MNLSMESQIEYPFYHKIPRNSHKIETKDNFNSKKGVGTMALKTTNIYVFWRDHMLLIQRSPFDSNLPNYWEAPAGHVDIYCEAGDSMLARKEALRELEEETSLEALAKDLLFLPSCSTPSHSCYMLFIHSRLPVKIRLSNEHQDFKWVKVQPNPTLNAPLRKEVAEFLRLIP